MCSFERNNCGAQLDAGHFFPEELPQRTAEALTEFFNSCEGDFIMDEDLAPLTRDELIAEVKKLRDGIRAHRDSTNHELCWHHPRLWGLLPEKMEPDVSVPAWPQFLRGCIRYRESLDQQIPNAPRVAEEFEET